MTKAAEAPADPRQTLEKSVFRDVELDLLIESRKNPRREFDAAGMADLVESIKRYGVLTPLIVRPVGNDGRYEIMAGARRFRASREAGLATVPCRVVEVENDTALEVVVVENLQRRDIHPLEEAEGFREILELSGGDVAGLCAKVGKKPSYVSKRLALLRLLEKGRRLYLQGKIGYEHAMQIARLQPEDQKKAIEYVSERDVTPAGLRRWIEDQVLLDLSKVPFSKDDPNLAPKAGTCKDCPKRTGTAKDLFDDIKEGDRCTDPSCFWGKMRAHIGQVQKALEGRGHKVYGLLASFRNGAAPKGVLSYDQWFEVRDQSSCDRLAKGIFVESARVGKVIDICTNPRNCKIHGSRSFPRRTPEELKKAREENLKARIERESRFRILRKVHESHKSMDLSDLQLLSHHVFDRLWHESKIALCRALKWEIPKHRNGGGYDFGQVEKKVLGLPTVEDNMRFLAAAVCAPDLGPGGSEPEILARFAAKNKVDMKAIRDAVAKELDKGKRAPKSASRKPGPAKRKEEDE